MQYIPAVFCFDAAYAPYAAVAAYSFFRAAQRPVKIYWIATPQAQPQAVLFKDHLQRLGMDISIVAPAENPFDAWAPKDHVTTAGNLRLLIPELIGERRILYLDCDVLVLSDLAALYQTDLKDFPIAGVHDPAALKFNRILRRADTYINSGVLLMDLERLRAERFAQQCLDIHARHGSDILYPDQCVINKFAEDRVGFLDPKWNRMIFAQGQSQETWRAVSEPGRSHVLHFMGAVKPWHGWCNPLIADFWWERARALALPGLDPVPVTEPAQALSLAQSLDVIGRFREASNIKSQIINHMLGIVPAQRS